MNGLTCTYIVEAGWVMVAVLLTVAVVTEQGAIVAIHGKTG